MLLTENISIALVKLIDGFIRVEYIQIVGIYLISHHYQLVDFLACANLFQYRPEGFIAAIVEKASQKCLEEIPARSNDEGPRLAIIFAGGQKAINAGV